MELAKNGDQNTEGLGRKAATAVSEGSWGEGPDDCCLVEDRKHVWLEREGGPLLPDHQQNKRNRSITNTAVC